MSYDKDIQDQLENVINPVNRNDHYIIKKIVPIIANLETQAKDEKRNYDFLKDDLRAHLWIAKKDRVARYRLAKEYKKIVGDHKRITKQLEVLQEKYDYMKIWKKHTWYKFVIWLKKRKGVK